MWKWSLVRVRRITYTIGILILLAVFFSPKIVSPIGISQPIPVGFKLLRNDEGRFMFHIFGGSSTSKSSCTYSASGLDPLVVTFDNEKVTVDPDEDEIVLGTIKAPDNAPIKNYNGNLEVHCTPIIEIEEATGSVITRTMNVPFEVSVVEKLEEPQLTIPEEEKPTISTSAIFAIIIIVILVVGVGYWFSKKSKKKK